MKITAVLISLLIVKTSATFFDDFRGAFVSVEHSFERMISDVVSNVKITIDCTIYAVEHALSLDGIFRNTSEHDKNCKKKRDTPAPSTEVVSTTYTPPTIKQKKLPISDRINDLSHHIETSLEKVNKSINSVVGKREAYHKIESVQLKLKNETERLTEVGALLSQELDNISKKVKKKINKINLVENKPTVAEIMSEVKILHELEETGKNTSEAKEIRHVFDEVLDILHTNTTEGPALQDTEIKDLIKSLEITSNNTFHNIQNQYSQWKEDEKKHINDIKVIVDSQKLEQKELPRDFRKIFERLSDATSGKSDKQISARSSGLTLNTSVTTVVPNQQQEVPTSTSRSLDINFFNKFFAPKGEKADKAVHEAQNFIRESKLAESFMNNILTNTENAVSVFDRPELWNSSK